MAAGGGELVDDCGIGLVWSFLVFLPFKVSAEWVILNLVTGMLVNFFGFCAAQHDESKAILSAQFVKDLRHVWDRHDRGRRGYIRMEELYAFMKEVPSEMHMTTIT